MITTVEKFPQAQSTGATKPGEETSAAKKSLGKDDFLMLLVKQLQTQDPMKPMEGVEFTSQLAQFTSLEQLTNVNNNLQTLMQIQKNSNGSSLVSLIGKKIEVPGNGIDHKSGQSETLGYSLGGRAEKVSIDILDSSGNVVKTLQQGPVEAGANRVEWNGHNSLGGNVASGSYTFSIRAVDASGNQVPAITFNVGVVTDVVFEGGEAFAMVNGKKISAAQISRITG